MLYRAINLYNLTPDVILSGTAKGADKLGEVFAKAENVKLEQYPADWGKHGKSAGYKRNVEMAENADTLLVLWDGKSKGTKHMIDIAESKGLAVYVWRFLTATT